MNRRGFLGAILAGCAAPAIVRADSLMRIILPKDTLLVPAEWIELPEFEIGFFESIRFIEASWEEISRVTRVPGALAVPRCLTLDLLRGAMEGIR